MSNLWKKHFKVPETCSRFIGVWPYQHPIKQKFLQTFCGSALTAILLFQVKDAFDEVDEDRKKLRVAQALYTTICVIKFYTLSFTVKRTKETLDMIESNWNSIRGQHEFETLNAYEETGANMCFLAAIVLIFSNSVYVLLPMRGAILNIILPLNISREKLLPFPLEQYKPPDGSFAANFVEEHYYYVIIVFCLYTYFIALPLLGADAFYFCCIQHGCAIFAITGYRLQNVTNQTEIHSTPTTTTTVRSQLSDSIRMHMKAIKLADQLRDMYAISFLLMLMFGTMLIAASGLEIVTKRGSAGSTQFAVGLFNCIVHLYFFCWTGQNLMEHSMRIFDMICDTTWFETSPVCQKSLMLVMLRSLSRPCTVIAGPLCSFNMQSFSVILKSSLSYFTLLKSFY